MLALASMPALPFFLIWGGEVVPPLRGNDVRDRAIRHLLLIFPPATSLGTLTTYRTRINYRHRRLWHHALHHDLVLVHIGC